MLVILTGDIQTGKTRWLTRILESLESDGVRAIGVLAPGVWNEHTADDGSITYEKLGIDNVLLPQGTRIPFARRRDLAQQEENYDPSSQSGHMQLQWAINDDAIAAVNKHLHNLAQELNGANPCFQKKLLVIDELGRLELIGKQGLTAAVELIEAGSTQQIQHAIIVVRNSLVNNALERFGSATWGGIEVIEPNDSGALLLRSLFH